MSLAPTLRSSLEVEDALVKAGDRLGMRVLFLRLVAAELPDNPWLTDLATSQHGGPLGVTRRAGRRR